MRETKLPSELVTQTASAPAATSPGGPATGIPVISPPSPASNTPTAFDPTDSSPFERSPWATSTARAAAIAPPMSVAATTTRRRGAPRGLGRLLRGQRPISVGGRQPQQVAVHRFRLRRGIGAELRGEEAAAALVDAKRLGLVAGGRVRVHQAPVAALAERLERDRLLGPPRRLRGVARAKAGIRQRLDSTNEDGGQLTAPSFDPGAVLAGKQRQPGKRCGRRRLRPSTFRVPRGKGRLRLVRGACGGQDVDPGALRELEAVAAECARQDLRAVEPAFSEQGAKLAGDHAQCLLPPRGRCSTPERVGKLVSGHRPGVLAHEVDEDKASLPPGQPLFPDQHAVIADRDAPRERDPQAHRDPVILLPGTFPDLAARSYRPP